MSYNCFCKPGYIRLDGDECIKVENCPSIILEDAVEEKEFKPKKPMTAVPFLEKTKIGGDLWVFYNLIEFEILLKEKLKF